jgi:hypothetical protein
MNEDEDLHAADLLKMLISKIHASNKSDGARLRIDLTENEMDWLCEWQAASEDTEDDDPAEEDIPPEESENLESDSRIRVEPVETNPVKRIGRKASDKNSGEAMTDFVFEVGDSVVVEVAGKIVVRQETEHGFKYIVQPHNPRAAAVHASPKYVFPEDDDADPVVGAVAA